MIATAFLVAGAAALAIFACAAWVLDARDREQRNAMRRAVRDWLARSEK